MTGLNPALNSTTVFLTKAAPMGAFMPTKPDVMIVVGGTVAASTLAGQRGAFAEVQLLAAKGADSPEVIDTLAVWATGKDSDNAEVYFLRLANGPTYCKLSASVPYSVSLNVMSPASFSADDFFVVSIVELDAPPPSFDGAPRHGRSERVSAPADGNTDVVKKKTK